MTTVRELADKLGVSKSAILDFAKSELGIKPEPRKAVQFDQNQTAVICSHFQKSAQLQQVADQQLLQSTAVLSADQTAVDCSLQMAELQIENARLQATVNGLEQQIQLLRDQLDVANAALEREQQRATGFWSRLGQKLLGSGKPTGGGE